MALRAVRYHGNLGGAIARFEYREWQERFLVASSALWKCTSKTRQQPWSGKICAMIEFVRCIVAYLLKYWDTSSLAVIIISG